MSTDEMLSAILPLFGNYYNVSSENVEEPFVAEAVFESHNEQYYLIKAAKVADIDTKEFVFFSKCDTLDDERLTYLDKTAWERGLSRVSPAYGHRNTDITLMIVADHIDETVRKRIRKVRHYKSYKWGFWGWSNYRLVAIGCSEGRAYYNHQGHSLKKLVGNILQKK